MDLCLKLDSYLFNRVYFSNHISNGLLDMFPYGDPDTEGYLREKISSLFESSLMQGDNLTDEMIEDARHQMQFHLSRLWATIYNQYIKMGNISQFNVSLVDMMLVEGSKSFQTVFKKYGNEYYVNITRALPTVNRAIQLQRDISIDSDSFDEVDVFNFNNRLELFEKACLEGYWILMDYCKSIYNSSHISKTDWEFNEHAHQFCIENIWGHTVPYTTFCQDLLEKINVIIDKLEVLDAQNNLIFRSVNFTMGHWNNVNRYYEIFNKQSFYNQIVFEDPIHLTYLIEDITYDFNNLKSFNKKLYDDLINKYFNGNTFDKWFVDHSDAGSITTLYNDIFNELSKFRDSAIVLNNELDVIINQLDKRMFSLLDNQGELYKKINSNLLKFIYFWEFHQKNTNLFTIDEGINLLIM